MARLKSCRDYEVGATARSGQYETGAGYAVTLPVVDLVEVGAGGGSVAWIDKAGALKVGPRSAGADPGPACFNKGGDPNRPLLMPMSCSVGSARTAFSANACRSTLAARGRRAAASRGPLGLKAETAALGILDVANSNMLRALRLVSTVRGYNPRDFVLVGFGGAGPLHAGALADDLGIDTVMIPLSPGVTCALGALITDVRHDYMQTCLVSASSADIKRLATTS